MSSAILYKFRSSTTFSPLPLPGTSARLLDIKRAIVKAKKLDSGSASGPEFDLQIQNATTEEVYEDESMILPRGTRVIVRRVACERGRGLVTRLAMGGGLLPPATKSSAASDGFYTFRSSDADGEDEFVDQEPVAQAAEVDESKELEALKAVTDQAGSMYSSGGGPAVSRSQVAGSGHPQRGGGPHFPKPPPRNNAMMNNRPNADPELREQQPQMKKRATGIPRTFLSLNAPTTAEGEVNADGTAADGTTDANVGGLAAQLQPNDHAFQSLIHRSGGQSLNDPSSKRRDIDYALKLTATPLPEHLTCGICNSVVKNAMLVPWDTEGRPACESCIRDGLAQNGFVCPMTGVEGVSPDDLHPNVGLRKAVDSFVKSVMEKMDLIERQIEEEEKESSALAAASAAAEGVRKGEEYDESGDRGILMTKKAKLNAASNTNGKKNKVDDPFGDDEFGGDVFDVVDNNEEEEDETPLEPSAVADQSASGKDVDNSNKEKDATSGGGAEGGATSAEGQQQHDNTANDDSTVPNNKEILSNLPNDHQQQSSDKHNDDTTNNDDQSATSNSATQATSRRREAPKRRGPPAGYVLGPAGGMGLASPPAKFGLHNVPPPPPPPPQGATMGGRGPGSDAGSVGGGSAMQQPSSNQMMGRGRGNGGGRFSQQFHGRGVGNSFQGRFDGRGGRSEPPYQQQYQGGYAGRGGRGGRYPGRGGYDQQQQQWVSCYIETMQVLIERLLPLFLRNGHCIRCLSLYRRLTLLISFAVSSPSPTYNRETMVTGIGNVLEMPWKVVTTP